MAVSTKEAFKHVKYNGSLQQYRRMVFINAQLRERYSDIIVRDKNVTLAKPGMEEDFIQAVRSLSEEYEDTAVVRKKGCPISYRAPGEVATYFWMKSENLDLKYVSDNILNWAREDNDLSKYVREFGNQTYIQYNRKSKPLIKSLLIKRGLIPRSNLDEDIKESHREEVVSNEGLVSNILKLQRRVRIPRISSSLLLEIGLSQETIDLAVQKGDIEVINRDGKESYTWRSVRVFLNRFIPKKSEIEEIVEEP